MGCMKKKNVIFMSVWMVSCFIIYQLYFFLTITSENSGQVISVFDHENLDETVHVRSEADKFINNQGVMKGVLGKQMVQYRPGSNNEFRCLHSKELIPFDQVNDDYCDCEDGTDEPSTSACPAGVFYCDTQYQKRSMPPIKVSSGQVNDGICDCCDGSDEWLMASNQKFLSQSNDKHYRHYVTLCANVC